MQDIDVKPALESDHQDAANPDVPVLEEAVASGNPENSSSTSDVDAHPTEESDVNAKAPEAEAPAVEADEQPDKPGSAGTDVATAEEARASGDPEHKSVESATHTLATEEAGLFTETLDVEALSAETEDQEPAEETITREFFLEQQPSPLVAVHAQLRAVLEAVIYITDEPLSIAQIATALQQPPELVKLALEELSSEFSKAEHGLTIREVAGGYKMATKPEYHESVRAFVKNLKPPLKLSLAALETLAVIAYKQPVTAPEIMEIRGVQGAGVLKTLIERKLVAPGGRKNVVGKPILYKTTKEFLIQFGLKDLTELPTLKEFEELGRLAFGEPDDSEIPAQQENLPMPAPTMDARPVQDVEQHPPIKEPEPEPEPIHDPDPAQDPGPTEDPFKAPVTN